MKAASPFNKQIFYHLAGWAILLTGWYLFRVDDFPNSAVAWEITGVKVAGLVVLVYITNYALIPRLLYKRKYIAFSAIYLVMIFAMGLLKIAAINQLLLPFYHRSIMFENFRGRVYDNIIPSFLLTSTIAGARLVYDYLTAQRNLSDISREKAETELKFLKSQINPHFLFNSLNSVYFLIEKENAEARQTLLRFSDLLRYQLYDCNADTIAIDKEIAYLKDYIRLQQIRRDQQYEIKLDIEDIRDCLIVPLLLVPFVENAFKHVSHHSDGRRNFVNVQLRRIEDTIYFEVENSKEGRDLSSGGGIGLANVKRRLELLYPGKHLLQIENNASTFKVELQLNIESC